MKRGDHEEEKGEASASKLQGMAMFEGQRLWRLLLQQGFPQRVEQRPRDHQVFIFPLQAVLATSSPKH